MLLIGALFTLFNYSRRPEPEIELTHVRDDFEELSSEEIIEKSVCSVETNIIATEIGNPRSQFVLGFQYADGRGVDIDIQEATK